MNRKSIVAELQKSKSLKRWDIRGINLSDIDFSGVVATGTSFSGCAMRHCRFDGAVVNEAVFEGCQLDGVSFKGATLEGAAFKGCRGLDDKVAQTLTKFGATVTRPSRSVAMFGVIALVTVAVFIIAIFVYRVNTQSDIETQTQSASPTPAMDVDAVLARGVKSLAGRNFEEALPLLKEAVEKSPDNLDARFQLARCLLEKGEFAEARGQFEAILARNPQQDIDVPARQFLAECYQREGKEDSADKVYQAVSRHYAQSPEIVRGLVLNHANLRWKTGKFQGALDLLNELLKLGDDEQDAGVYLLMGLVHKDQGAMDKAVTYFEKVAWEFDVKLRPVLDARVQLALQDIREGKKDKAVDFLKDLLGQGADEGQIFNALFQVYQKMPGDGLDEQTGIFLDTLARLFADSPKRMATLHVEYGKNAMAKNRLKEALTHFEAVVELSKDPVQSAWASESIEEILRRDSQRPTPTPTAPTPPMPNEDSPSEEPSELP